MHYKPTDSRIICCIHPLILPTSKTLSRSLNFLDFDVYVVMTPGFPTNQRKCAISLRSVAIQTQHRAQQFDRQSALQTSQKEKNERIPFTLTYHSHNLAVKNIILKNFKLLQNDNETGRIFSQPPLISFQRDKVGGNLLTLKALQTLKSPGYSPFNADLSIPPTDQC